MPPGPLSIRFLLLWRNAASRAFRGRRGIVLVLLSMLPVALALIQMRYARHVGDELFLGPVLMLVFQIVVPLAGLFVGVAVLGDEIEGRTLTYLFTRPQPRQVVLLARYGGLATAFGLLLFGTVALASYVWSSRIPLTAREIAGTAAIAALGFLVYAAFFAALRVFVRRALFAGFILGFIFEGVVSKLPGTGISRCSVWHHLALLEVRLLGDRSSAVHGLLKGIAADETTRASLVTLGAIFVLSLAAGAWRVCAQETQLANAAT